MCNVFCKEFKGWCKSFTRTEAFLTILEGFLLFLVFGFLVFLILHFLACPSDTETLYNVETTTAKLTTFTPKTKTKTTVKSTFTYNAPTTLAPECTWKPSEKTKAYIKYYEYNTTTYKSVDTSADITDYSERDKEIGHPDENKKDNDSIKIKDYSLNSQSGGNKHVAIKLQPVYDYGDDIDFKPDESDGEEAEDLYQRYVLALVKVNPPRNIIFGCTLTIVTEYWTVTAASCIEAIEEVDSLDSFVMIEDYGGVRKGRTHVISDVQIHPMYEGVNKSYDLTALKSEDSLMRGSGYAVELPSLIDYFMITIGERLTLLGFGPYRTIDTGPLGKRLHKVYVYSLPPAQCAAQAEAETWSLRHLWGGAAVRRGRCGAGALCAAALHSRGAPCNYCAGAPLLRGPALVGVMSNNQQCGVACEPQLYVNIAEIRDWLDFVTGTK
ncbi:trypsin eta-like [Manduca sexta]|uniref:Peptidase S1 domain-containing protein n=1 Tax=Manduca sexta TaxID=7130 RepID=A0A921ZSU7_MANSE|nr:trypsin eta-like [Manduca sexta]KAG6462758.1 hypothetical protein O3G_MSEX013450 [Manduca sexta]